MSMILSALSIFPTLILHGEVGVPFYTVKNKPRHSKKLSALQRQKIKQVSAGPLTSVCSFSEFLKLDSFL